MSPLARFASRACRCSAGVVVLGLAACAAAGVDSAEEDIALPERRGMVGRGSDDGGASPAADASVRSGDTQIEEDAGAASSRDAAPNGPGTGTWSQANGEECVSYCAARGATNVPSPEGARCTSGENIPQSALAAGITYDKCFPSCNAHLAAASPTSVGKNCYADGQKRDDDSSDVTRGCFCR